jgi:hypothetical protein
MNKAQSLRLFEVTSAAQTNNGTICFYDPIAKCFYMSYENGYVRRSYEGSTWFGQSRTNIYQLNPTVKITSRSKKYPITKRVLISDPEERLELIYRAAVNYRNTLNKRNNG